MHSSVNAMRTLTIFILLYLIAGFSFGTTIRVPMEQPTIQAGIDAAANGDTVLVAGDVYTGEGNRDIDFGGKAVVLKSENGPDYAVIDCEGSSADPHRGFFFHSGETDATVIDGFTVQNGYGFDNGQGRSIGGGVYCDSSSSPTFVNCIIHRNQAGWGSGMYCLSSSPQLIDCTFSENGYDITSSGGGLYCKFSSLILTGCTFRENRADEQQPGGGFHCWLSSATLTDCKFIGNWAYSGGAISSYWSSMTASGCTFIGNRTESEFWVSLTFGGGIEIYNSDVALTNCTFAENGAYALGEDPHGYGGAVAISNLQEFAASFDNCLIAFNEGDDAVSCVNAPPYDVNLSCCDIYGNQGGDWIGCIADLAGQNGNISADPLFCDPDAGDFHLAVASPALPANNDCGVLIGALDIGCGYTCADADSDGSINMGDAVFIIHHIFFGGPAPVPLCAGDANGDAAVNIGDVVYLINYIFKGGSAPVADCCS
jgi:hypothetical protein